MDDATLRWFVGDDPATLAWATQFVAAVTLASFQKPIDRDVAEVVSANYQHYWD